jgi:hypothetical protein
LTEFFSQTANMTHHTRKGEIHQLEEGQWLIMWDDEIVQIYDPRVGQMLLEAEAKQLGAVLERRAKERAEQAKQAQLDQQSHAEKQSTVGADMSQNGSTATSSASTATEKSGK